MTRRQTNLRIVMGAAAWGVHVRKGSEWVWFDLRAMDKRERSIFHRELMNAFRASRQ